MPKPPENWKPKNSTYLLCAAFVVVLLMFVFQTHAQKNEKNSLEQGKRAGSLMRLAS